MEPIEIFILISVSIRGKFKVNKEKASRSKTEYVTIVRGLGIYRENVIFTTEGSTVLYIKPEDKKIGKLGLCLSEQENRQYTEKIKPDLYTTAVLVKHPWSKYRGYKRCR